MSQPAPSNLRDPNELRPHPLIKPMPRWAKDSDEWRAFVDDIREHGVREQIKVCGDLVVDGETRRLAAKQLKLQVPVEEVGEDEVLAIIIRNLLLRRNVVSKSALAYLAYPLMKPAHEEALARHLARLKTGNRETIPHAVRDGGKIEDFAEQIGVGERLFQQAAKIHELLAEQPDLRTETEESILVGGSGLGGILAGFAGRESTKQKPKGDKGAFGRVEEALKATMHRWKDWGRIPDDKRNQALALIRRNVTAMPEDVRAEVKRAIREIEKAEKEAA
jgi:ParB-like chromosome segregation protein Spo0J